MVKIGINGFGRIGRCVFRAGFKRKDVEFVAVNDVTDAKTLAYLLKYDSVHGMLDARISSGTDYIEVDGKRVKVLSEKEPDKIPWKSLGVEIVIESTGKFLAKEDAEKHLKAGAKAVILSAPGKGEMPSIVYGVNTEKSKNVKILDNASCTTNCLVPVVYVLEKEFGIEKGLMTTIHAYTSDQRLIDTPHKDLRRARTAGVNIIPTTTGAAKATGKVIPSMQGKLDGIAIRVPVADGSLVDLVAILKKNVTPAEINAAMKKYAEGELKGILEYTEDPIVSSDILGNENSSIFDASATMVVGGNLVKVFSWYDNEMGYSHRVVDLAAYMAKKDL